MLTALFGINDGSLNLAVNLLILVLVVVWIALVWWTYADARRRIDDSVLVATATAASLFPFIGTIVYTILRPPEFLDDARERELEMRSAELRLRRLAETSCPRCEHPIELAWLRCPECQHHLKDPCVSCGRPVDPRWSICPHCEAAVAGGGERPQSKQAARKRPARSSEQRARPAAKRPAQRSGAKPSGSATQRQAAAKGGTKTRKTRRPAGSEQRPAGSGRGDGGPARGDADSGSGSADESERRPRRRPTKRT